MAEQMPLQGEVLPKTTREFHISDVLYVASGLDIFRSGEPSDRIVSHLLGRAASADRDREEARLAMMPQLAWLYDLDFIRKAKTLTSREHDGAARDYIVSELAARFGEYHFLTPRRYAPVLSYLSRNPGWYDNQLRHTWT